MEDYISRTSAAYKSVKVKVLTSLGEDLVPLVTEALKHSCHPTLADAVLELSRSELLFVALLQALTTKNMVMSGRLLQAADDWLMFPRITAYMGGKLHTEFRCTNEFVGGAAEFAHTLNGTGLITVPQDILVYLDELARNVRNEIKQRETALRRQASAGGEPQEVDDPESQDGNSKKARRRSHRQRRSADASQRVESRANEVTANMQDQAVQTMETTQPESASASASSPPQTTPTAASSAMQTSVASASSPPQTMPTAASSAMQTSVASASSPPQTMPTAASSAMQTSVASASSPPQTTPTAASSAMHTSVASASSPPQTTPTAASSAMQTSVASVSSLQVQRATEWLFTAVEKEDLLGINTAIIKGADINGRNADGFTPLHVAAARGLLKAMSVLLMAKANKEVEDNAGDRPLHTAAANGQNYAVALLVAAGADLHATGQGGSTPAVSAFGHTSTVLLLDTLSLSPVGRERAVSSVATEALWDALNRDDDPQAIRAAIENGADIEGRDANGWTALHRAAYRGRVQVLCVLLRAGADKEALDKVKNRPLHIAARHEHDVPPVALLAVAGADLRSIGERGWTPLEMAEYYNNHRAIAHLLRSLGG